MAGLDSEWLHEMMPCARTIGIELVSASGDEVRGAFDWAPHWCTGGEVLHGGILMAFADTLGAVCAFLNLRPGESTSTIESKSNFFRGVREGRVAGVSQPLHVGRTIVVVQTDLRDHRGRRVAQVTQTQAVLAPH